MDRDELAHAVREAYRCAMKARRTNEDAISDCVAVLQQHRVAAGEPEARKLVARMIAEEPLG